MAKAEPTVVALTSGYFGVDGQSVQVIAGETFRTSDPVVKKYPAHFGKPDGERIEQATAAPGEKRG